MRISDWSSDVCSSDLRNPHLVAHRELSLSFDPAAIDPHLTRANKPIDVRFWHARQLFQKEIIDPLAVLAGRPEDHTSKLHSLIRKSYAVYCLHKHQTPQTTTTPYLTAYLNHFNRGPNPL